jgi:hypothetical protein
MISQKVQMGEFVLTLRDVIPDDVNDVLMLHGLVFGSDVDSRWFEWKYGQGSDQGRGLAIGAWHEGQLVAYCGGLPRELRLHNQNLCGLQIGDVMVHPKWRGVLGRRGPFFQVSKHFYDSHIGASNNRPFELGFGFPNDRHLRLAVLLGLLRDGGAIESLHWSSLPAQHCRLPWFWRWQALLPTDLQFDQKVNAAWRRMQPDVDQVIAGQRDATYVRWRYIDRPRALVPNAKETVGYKFFELRYAWRKMGSGIAVMDLNSRTPQWLDWIGSTALMPVASYACRIAAAQAGAHELVAWASRAVAEKLAHTDILGRTVCAGLGIPTSSIIEPQGTGWWLMGGDTDFL